jgi:hypothetical protein
MHISFSEGDFLYFGGHQHYLPKQWRMISLAGEAKQFASSRPLFQREIAPSKKKQAFSEGNLGWLENLIVLLCSSSCYAMPAHQHMAIYMFVLSAAFMPFFFCYYGCGYLHWE